MKKIYSFLIVLVISHQVFAQPVISSFSPASGKVGDTVIINGNNFSASISGNIVYFGSVKAQVIAASITTISAVVPNGATCRPVTVTVANQTAYSPASFVPSYSNITAVHSGSFVNKLDSFIRASYDFTVMDFDGDGKNDVANITISPVIGSAKALQVRRNISNSGSIKFATAVNYAIGNMASKVTAGDLDGDGMPDLAITNKTSNSVSLFLNNSSPGTIAFAAQTSLVTGSNPQGLEIKDIDGDGMPDIIISNETSNTISVYRNTSTAGTIFFAAKIDFTTGGKPQNITSGDFDGDGKPDIAVCNYNDSSFSVLLNNSTNGVIVFAGRVDFNTGSKPQDIKNIDLDGDGKLDIAITDNGTNKISVFKNTGSNSLSFSPKTDYTVGQAVDNDHPSIQAEYLSVGDMNGDGRPDLVVISTTNYPVNFPSATSSFPILMNNSNNGNIILAPQVLILGGYVPKAIEVADFDGDNKPDFATLTLDDVGGHLAFFLNRVGGPLNQVVCPPSAGTYSITCPLSGTAYQWQLDNGSGFNNLTVTYPYSGVNSSQLNIASMPSSYNGYKYRCIVDGQYSDVYQIRFENTKKTGTNLAWENAANWSCNSLPDANTNVMINSGSIIINSNVTIWSLTVAAGATVTVNTGFTLTVLH